MAPTPPVKKDPKWIRDMNTSIMIGPDRKPIHWKDAPPDQIPIDGGDYEDCKGVKYTNIHQQYRTCLSENMLMNLFRDAYNENRRMTFNDYYRGWTMVEVLSFFIDRIPSIPTRDTTNAREQGMVKTSRINAAERHLKDARDKAIEAAKAYQAPDDPRQLRMKDLYLQGYSTHPQIDFLRSIRTELAGFQRALKWICLPFLQYPEVDNHHFPRPTPTDLEWHLNGHNDAQNPFLGIGGWDYHDFLFYETDINEDAIEYRNARYFAYGKALLGREKIYERVRRECKDEEQDSWENEDYFGNFKAIAGGGNGYKCGCGPSGKICVVSTDARDYCANGGAGCPTCP
jgi:hypothetical protein